MELPKKESITGVQTGYYAINKSFKRTNLVLKLNTT